MIEIQCFTFNPFQENTYILYDKTKECIIIDPGCYDKDEQECLNNFIESKIIHHSPSPLLNLSWIVVD